MNVHKITIVTLALSLATFPLVAVGTDLGTVFTYQGQLKDGGVPADGVFDFEFSLWDDPGTGCPPVGGNQIGSAIVFDGAPGNQPSVTVSNGLFTVLLNEGGEFGEQAFNGEARWLEIAVSPAGVPPMTTLCPRQPVTSTPYALQTRGIFVNDAGWVGINTTDPTQRLDVAGYIRSSGTSARLLLYETDNPDEDFSWVVNNGNLFVNEMTESGWLQTPFLIQGTTGNVGIGGTGPTERLHVVGNIRASGTIMSGVGSNVITIDGTASSKQIISSDDLELHVGDGRAFRIETDATSPNLIGGHASNYVETGAHGATIGGGGQEGVGIENRVLDHYGTLGGGFVNWVGSDDDDPGTAEGATIGGGEFNQATAAYATIGGGYINLVKGAASVVPGGRQNSAGGDYSFAGGRRAEVRNAADTGDADGDEGTFVWADSTDASFTSTGPDQFLIRAGGGVGINTPNPGGYALNVNGPVNADDLLINGVSVGGGPGGIGGGGTADFLAKFTGATVIGDSAVYENAGKVGIGTVNPGGARLRVDGAGSGTGSPAIRVHNTHASGIGIFSTTNSSDSNLVLTNEGTGDLIRGFSGPGGSDFVFQVRNDGTTKVSVLEITGADLAEKFPVSDEVQPGMVMEIDPDNPGNLRVAQGAYNRRVAGVVSGANGLAAGAILGNLPGHGDAPPIALSGRVWTWCDASNGPIQPGDLLTTSNTPGHAAKVLDYRRAQGAIIGKAMSSLESGKGLVLVLVSPQ